MPKTMTRIEGVVQPTGSPSTVVTVLGGEKVGTTDKALGDRALLAWEKSQENMWEIEFKQRDGRLYLLDFEVIEAPPELGGPTGDNEASEEGSPSSDETSGPADLTLDDLIQIEARLTAVEEFLKAKGFERG